MFLRRLGGIMEGEFAHSGCFRVFRMHESVQLNEKGITPGFIYTQ